MQQASWLLAATALGETGLVAPSLGMPLIDRYYRALAQPTGRKLALLVGINQYPRIASLGGCLTDVELQRELLIHRFGFLPQDILTLTNKEATRQNIETAFWEHLTQQAVAGDVVLFHFSGYGSRIDLDGAANPNKEARTRVSTNSISKTNSLVPVDGILYHKGVPVVNNLLEKTLLLLLRSLPTDRVTTVLDTSYADASDRLQGNLRIRSLPEFTIEQPSEEALAVQQQLMEKLKLSPTDLERQSMPGVVLAASAPNCPATEAAWGGFSAGLFTYALTQYLWQATSPTTIQIGFNRAAESVEQLAGKDQQPQLSGQRSQQPSLLAYDLNPVPSSGADGVALAVEDSSKTALLWLAGLPTRLVAYYGINSIVEAIDITSPDVQPLQLQIRSREGLTARARVLGAPTLETPELQVGQLVREYIRVLPRQVGLTIALDASLDRIERVDATSALGNIPLVASVVAAGEQPADYLFGKARKGDGEMGRWGDGARERGREGELLTQHSTLNTQHSTGGYGLFSPNGDLIADTMGEPTEAIKSAVNRLSPKLQKLLAAKLWRLSGNETSSRLGVRVTLETGGPVVQVSIEKETTRSPFNNQKLANNPAGKRLLSGEGIPSLLAGDRVQYRIENYSDRPLYLMLFALDSNGNVFTMYASDSSQLEGLTIPPEKTIIWPQPNTANELKIQGFPGLAQTYSICSSEPFTNAIAAMGNQTKQPGAIELANPLEVAQAVLQDLHQASGIAPETIGTAADTYTLNVNNWVTFNFNYQVKPRAIA